MCESELMKVIGGRGSDLVAELLKGMIPGKLFAVSS